MHALTNISVMWNYLKGMVTLSSDRQD